MVYSKICYFIPMKIKKTLYERNKYIRNIILSIIFYGIILLIFLISITIFDLRKFEGDNLFYSFAKSFFFLLFGVYFIFKLNKNRFPALPIFEEQENEINKKIDYIRVRSKELNEFSSELDLHNNELKERSKELANQSKILVEQQNLVIEKAKYDNKKIEDFINFSSDFKKLSYISHNIKNAILNMEWRLNDYYEKEELKNVILMLQQDLQKIRENVNEFNQMNELEEKKEFILKDLFEYYEKLFSQDLKREKINFKIDYNLNEELIIKQEFNSIFQIINNLIANSFKALEKSENKEIFVKIFYENYILKMFLSDTGCGIKNNIKDKIFDYNFSNSGGKGVGLTYVKERIEKINGEIKLIDNFENYSTTFELTIPIKNETLDSNN